jgi:Flp pilus assembly protein TadG
MALAIPEVTLRWDSQARIAYYTVDNARKSMKMKTHSGNRLQFMAPVRGVRHAAESRGVSGYRRFFGKRLRAHLRGGEEGGSLVEFALVAPLMLLLMTGMFSVVMALMNYQQLGNAVNTASQQVMAARSNGSDPCAAVVSTITTALPSWTASKFTYTVQIYTTATASTTYGPTTGSSFSCTAGEANLTANYPAAITVTYAYTWLPVMWSRWASALNLSGNLKATAVTIVD